MNSMKSTSSVRIHLDVSEQPSRRSSFDLNMISSLLSPTKTRTSTNINSASSNSLDGQRNARFSSLSSSYAQFLKRRDADKTVNKKAVSVDRTSLVVTFLLFNSIFIFAYSSPKKIIVCYYHRVNGLKMSKILILMCQFLVDWVNHMH
jgi:hypothetical protein